MLIRGQAKNKQSYQKIHLDYRLNHLKDKISGQDYVKKVE